MYTTRICTYILLVSCTYVRRLTHAYASLLLVQCRRAAPCLYTKNGSATATLTDRYVEAPGSPY
jgi:hypothetical protein